MTCPCTNPIEGKGFSKCPLYNCKMTATFCDYARTKDDWRKMYELGVGPYQDKTGKDKLIKEREKKSVPKIFRLGDNVETALKTMGITSEKVSAWLGRPCGCPERRERLNRLGAWAHRIITGQTDKAEEYLEQILEDQ